MRLTKWYLDVVDPRGRAAIVYHASVRAGPIRIRAASVLWREADGATWDRTTLAGGGGPMVVGGSSGAWACSGLGLDAQWQGQVTPIAADLGDGRFARFAWRCVAPAARVRVAIGEHRLEGDGYVERLDVAAPLSAIPIDELRWGRFVADSRTEGEAGGAPGAAAVGVRSLVWIEWRGPQPVRLAWLDGRPLDDIWCDEGGVRAAIAGNEAALTIERAGVLRDDPVRASLGPLGAVPGLVPRRIMEATERKWIARGELRVAGLAEPVRGWVIHELVRFGEAAARSRRAMRHAVEAG